MHQQAQEHRKEKILKENQDRKQIFDSEQAAQEREDLKKGAHINVSTKNRIASANKADRQNPHKNQEDKWNTNVNHFGSLFDKKLNKRELFPYSDKANLTKKKLPANHRKNETTTVFKDVRDVEEVLKNENNKMLNSIKQTYEMKLDNMEEILRQEKQRKKQNDIEFDKRYEMLTSQARDNIENGKYNKNFLAGKYKSQNGSKITSTIKKRSKKRGKSGGGPSSKVQHRIEDKQFYLSPGDGAPVNMNDGNCVREDEFTWTEQLENMKDAYKEKIQDNKKTLNIRESALEKSVRKGDLITFSPPKKFTGPRKMHHSPVKQKSAHVQFMEDTMQEINRYSTQDRDQKTQDHVSNNLAEIKQGLDPVIKRWAVEDRKMGFKSGGPSAQLVEKSAGRLIKVYNDKLTKLIIDDLLLEVVAIQNHKEEMEQKVTRDNDLKKMAGFLLDELKDINGIQEELTNVVIQAKDIFGHHGENFGHTGGNFGYTGGNSGHTGGNFGHTGGNFGQTGGHQTIDLAYPRSLAENIMEENRHQTGGYSGPIEFEKTRFRKEELAKAYQKGPYRVGNKTGFGEFDDRKVALSIDTDLLISIVTHGADFERLIERQNYLTKNYVDAVQVVSETIIGEIFEDIYAEFDKVQTDFVAEVIQGEFD